VPTGMMACGAAGATQAQAAWACIRLAGNFKAQLRLRVAATGLQRPRQQAPLEPRAPTLARPAPVCKRCPNVNATARRLLLQWPGDRDGDSRAVPPSRPGPPEAARASEPPERPSPGPLREGPLTPSQADVGGAASLTRRPT
jgi:hypothetical protein